MRSRRHTRIVIGMHRVDRHSGVLSALDPLSACSHVCWVVDSPSRFEDWTAACLADGARRGERPLRFVRQPPAAPAADPSVPSVPSVNVLDPAVSVLQGGPLDRAAMYAMLRTAAAEARTAGYRGLRLVADMDWLRTPSPDPAEVAAYELLLDEVVTDLGATVVCAYRPEHFDPHTIAGVVAVHPSTLGPVAVEPGFRIFHFRGSAWEVSGEIDLFNADAFARALATLADGASSIQLQASGLRFVAVAGIGALVELALSRPDLRITVVGAARSFARCWALLGYDRTAPAVRFADRTPDRGRSQAGPARPAGDR